MASDHLTRAHKRVRAQTAAQVELAAKLREIIEAANVQYHADLHRANESEPKG